MFLVHLRTITNLSPNKQSYSCFHFKGKRKNTPIFSCSLFHFPHFQRQKFFPSCIRFVMIFLQTSQAAKFHRRIYILALDLHHNHFCIFFMFRISHRDTLGFLYSCHLSFCENFSPLLCESFICIGMAWFFKLDLFFIILSLQS